jgi:hypothetical protein
LDYDYVLHINFAILYIKFGKNGAEITSIQIKSHTLFGVKCQSDAMWTSHILSILETATKGLSIFRMLKYKFNRKILCKIYFAFINPVLEYADVVFDNCFEKYY